MMRRKNRNLIVLTVTAVIAGAIFGSFIYFNIHKPYEPVESISIGLSPNEVNTLIYVAETQQFFASNGLGVTIIDNISGPANIDSMLKGEVDIATAAEFVFVRKTMVDESNSVLIISAIDRVFNTHIVARKDRGISNISDIEGKIIGLSLGTSNEFHLGRFLDLNGISRNNITLVNISPPETPEALANGTVDAVVAWQPYINTIENLIGGDNIITWTAQEDQEQYIAAFCTNDWATAHPDLVIRFLRALAQAEDFAIHNPAKTKTVVAGRLSYSSEYLETVWDENKFSLSLDQSLILAMENEARWMMRNNLTNETKVPDFLNYIYPDGLMSVDPRSVNLIL